MKQSAARNANTGRWSESNIGRGVRERRRKKIGMMASKVIGEMVVAAWVMGLRVGSSQCRVQDSTCHVSSQHQRIFLYCRTSYQGLIFKTRIVSGFQYIIKAQQKGLVLWSGSFVGQKASVCCICTPLSALELFPLGQSRNPPESSSFMCSFSLSSLQQLCKWNQSSMSSIDESAAGLTRLLQTQRWTWIQIFDGAQMQVASSLRCWNKLWSSLINIRVCSWLMSFRNLCILAVKYSRFVPIWHRMNKLCAGKFKAV